MRAFLLVAGLASCASNPPPKACTPEDYAAIALSCGDDVDVCNAAIDARHAECAEKIEGGE